MMALKSPVRPSSRTCKRPQSAIVHYVFNSNSEDVLREVNSSLLRLCVRKATQITNLTLFAPPDPPQTDGGTMGQSRSDKTPTILRCFERCVMASHRPSLREVLIVIGLLRPEDAAENLTAQRSCSLYLQARMHMGSCLHSDLDQQLAIAVLERWLAL